MSAQMKRSTATIVASRVAFWLVGGLTLAWLTACGKTYDFELSFTGLGVLKTPRDAPAEIVLPTVAQGTYGSHYVQEHLPRLSFWAKDVTSPREGCVCKLGDKCVCKLQSTPGGDEEEVCDLSGNTTLEVVAPGNPALKLEGPYNDIGEEPGSTAEEAKLDWLTPLNQVFPKARKLDPSKVASTIVLPGGYLHAKYLPTASSHYLKWTFLDDAGKSDKVYRQALAARMALSIVKLDRKEDVTLALRQDAKQCRIDLRPKIDAETMLETTVSHLPEEEAGHSGDPLYHFAALQNLVQWQAGEPIRYPKNPQPSIGSVRMFVTTPKVHMLTTTSVFCPPLRQ